MKDRKNYFKVITDESNTDSADILLYGVIGQDFWWDESLNAESITDVQFAKEIKRLEAKYNRINVRINSPGGSMYHGNAIITAIQNSKAEIHTYNDGLAASMGADIWLAGNVRHMAKNALLMVHAPSSIVWGTAKEMRQEADVLDKFEYTAIAVMAAATGLTEAAVKEKFYDYEDHWFTAPEAEAEGFISKVDEYEVEGTIENAQKMSLKELMMQFAPAEAKSEQKGGLAQITNFLSNEIQIGFSRLQKSFSSTPKNNDDMTIEGFKKGLAENELSVEQVTEVLKEMGYEVTKEAAPELTPEVDVEDLVSKAVAAATATLQAEIDALKKAPAQDPTLAAGDEDPADETNLDERTKMKMEMEADSEKFAKSNGIEL